MANAGEDGDRLSRVDVFAHRTEDPAIAEMYFNKSQRIKTVRDFLSQCDDASRVSFREGVFSICGMFTHYATVSERLIILFDYSILQDIIQHSDRVPRRPRYNAALASFAFVEDYCLLAAMTLARPNLSVRALRLADRLEAWGAAFFFGVFKLLPLDCASAVGGALARRIGPFLGVSKHARHNIRRAFPGLSETEIADLIGSMWSNLGRVAAEYPHLRKIRVFEPGGRVETHGFEHVDRAVGGRAADDRLLRPYCQLGDRHACRSPARNISRPNLPRSQQSTDGPHDRAVPRRSRRIHSEGCNSRV